MNNKKVHPKTRNSQSTSKDTRNKARKNTILDSDLSIGIISTIIGGLVVAVIMLYVSSHYNSNNEQKQKIAFLNTISIGQSRTYITDMLGSPIVSASLPNYASEKDVPEGNYSNSGYKLENCVVLCLFNDDSLVAFAIVVNDNNIYEIPSVSSLSWKANNRKLLNFTYSDLNDSLTLENLDVEPWILGYSTTGYAYNTYAEIYSGAHVNHFNASFIGNYMYQQTAAFNPDLNTLFNSGNVIMNYQKGNSLLGYDEAAMLNTTQHYTDILNSRKVIYPNLFGIISFELVHSFDYVTDIVQDDSRAELLFGDWN